MSTPLLERWATQIPEECLVLHLQADYHHILQGLLASDGEGGDEPEADILALVHRLIDGPSEQSEKEVEALLLPLYKHDLWTRRLKHSHAHYIGLGVHELAYFLPQVAEQLKGSPDPASRCVDWDPIVAPVQKSFSARLEEKICLFNDRRLLLEVATSLSDVCQERLHLGIKAGPVLAPWRGQVDLMKHRVCMIADFLLSPEQAHKILPEALPAKCPSVMIVVFSHFAHIRALLQDPLCRHHLATGRLKLWFQEEWKSRLHAEYERIRSSILHCSTVLAPEGSALKMEIEAELDRCYAAMLGSVRQEHAEALKYYASEAFEQRLEAIAAGERPRILVEQACRSLSTRPFSRACAAVFRQQGYEVFIHEPCPDDQMDFAIASTLEINRFRPDLVIRVPNIYGYAPFREIPGLPVLLPLQHLEPHVGYVEHVSKEPMARNNMLLITEERFGQALLDAGVHPQQLLFSHLPAEAPRFDLDGFEPGQQADVGLVKTLYPGLGLLGRVFPEREMTQLTQPERQAIERAQRMLDQEVESGGGMDFYSCRKLASPHQWGEALEGYYHERLCAHFLHSLHHAGYSLALSGANWDKYPALSQSAYGHVKDRTAYQKRFLRNKINLSIHPWDQYHPAIFDGGRCAAFFLVYRVPEAYRWQDMPDYLKQGEHFDSFDSCEELKEKVAYYLERPDLRAEIGLRLKKALDECHSYERVCERLIQRFRGLLKSSAEEALLNVAPTFRGHLQR
jgi:hypothetical protein